ncbi:MAG: CcdB family protein [Roseibium sp.]|nr:CcdB family protein [Roseibium sp.]
MARFEVRRLRSSNLMGVELQADLFDDLNTRVLAPLIPADEIESAISRLNPSFTINGRAHVMLTQHMAAVPVQELGDTVTDLSAHRDRITAATDFLFQGF